jgi:indole-3-glycerol phosphate synthase
MENILGKIIATKRQEIEKAKASKPYCDILREAEVSMRKMISFREALLHSHTGIISEFKRKSPSKDFINQDAKAGVIVPGYVHSGASAVSILTDTDYFGGSLADLILARTLIQIPILRKDFIIDPYQICEAKLYGADVILLIAAALSPGQCGELASFAHHLGLEVLLEIHQASELGYIHGQVDVVGINNRNLSTFVTDVQTSYDLAKHIPTSFVKISESGISMPETVLKLRQAGFSGFLMGENFMKQSDPADALKGFIQKLWES